MADNARVRVRPFTRYTLSLTIASGILFAGAADAFALSLPPAGSSGGHGPLWSLFGVCVVTGLGLLRWFTTTYRIGPEQVQLRRGLLRRRVLSVPRDRIRTVDVTAHAMHRLLGLAKVTVGTGRLDDDGQRVPARRQRG